MGIASLAGPTSARSSARIASWAVDASCGVAVLPVPIAHTGS
jgi:hypothetical protein